MAKILGIGNVVLDILLQTDHYPHEDEEIRAESRRYEVGGNVCNSLFVLQQLGHDPAIMASLAADSAAKQLLDGLSKKQIHTQHIQRHINGQTPISYVLQSGKTGTRTITHFRDLEELSFDYFAKVEIEQYDWLHFEGRNIENLSGMFNIARTFLTYQPISLEVEKAREGIEALFPLANVIIFSHHYAKQKGYQTPEELLKQVKPLAPNSQLICTWGKEGAWFQPISGEIQHQPALQLEHTVDTLGAGDTFNAGLIDALINQQSLSEAVLSATALAARKCQQQGLENLLSTPPAKRPLANLKKLSNAKALVVPCDALPHSVILIQSNDEVKAYANNCPHQDVPLDEAYKIDINPFEKTMKCSVHDAYFSIGEGICIEGPCLNDELTPIPIKINAKGDIYLAEG